MDKSKYTFPTINFKETGINLRRIMSKRGITLKDVKEYLNLTGVQSVFTRLDITEECGGYFFVEAIAIFGVGMIFGIKTEISEFTLRGRKSQ